MHNATTKYDPSLRWESHLGCVRQIMGFFNAKGMSRASPRPRRLLQHWALLAALVLCAGQSVAATHLHFEEHVEEVCSLCAACESSHVSDVEQIDIRPSEWLQCNSLPVYSALLSACPYQVGLARALPLPSPDHNAKARAGVSAPRTHIYLEMDHET